MNENYEKIESAIEYLHNHIDEQPSLKKIARTVGLSEAHFQRVFSAWAGVSPKRYLQTITVEHAKKLLQEQKSTLDVSLSLGLSSTSRLHEHFVNIEAVTPGEYKTKGSGLEIDYGIHSTPFGDAFIAVTKRGICKLSFVEDGYEKELEELEEVWKNATLKHSQAKTKNIIELVFNIKKRADAPLSILVFGTNFQVSVWKALLELPFGSLSSYGEIASKIGKPKASRAVGSAIGQNPIAFLIPCHRVIQQSGKIGGYRWGVTKKHLIHAWEMANNGTF
jgi:AraC family transcriptional regulator, regulatory protein of adaptative response / methylated-DNA-[protein]-cysteine methyltransferase